VNFCKLHNVVIFSLHCRVCKCVACNPDPALSATFSCTQIPPANVTVPRCALSAYPERHDFAVTCRSGPLLPTSGGVLEKCPLTSSFVGVIIIPSRISTVDVSLCPMRNQLTMRTLQERVLFELFLAITIRKSVNQSIHPPVYLSIYLFIYLSIYLSIQLCIYLYIYPSTQLPIYLSIYLRSIHPSA
jgi:hypothetical protein